MLEITRLALLVWTKTLALVFSSLLSITLVPALMPLFIRHPSGLSRKILAARNDQSNLSAGVVADWRSFHNPDSGQQYSRQ